MKNNIWIFGLLIFTFFIQGCHHRYERIHPYPKKELFMSYKIGEEHFTQVGSEMIFVSNIYSHFVTAYRPLYTLPPDAKGFGMNPSQTWVVWAKRDDGILKIMVEGPNPYLSLDIYDDGTIPDETIQDWKLKDRKLPDKKLFEKIYDVPYGQIEAKGFKGELIYSGISKNTIKITYREYLENLARPAFYQELTYDLDQSDLIQFKSLKIRVLRADNSAIKFIVVDDGGLPWIPKNR